ncbi:UNVERIFIED_CONTAM: hypothetical protein FKN15_063928 [Acipenser sinensis]
MERLLLLLAVLPATGAPALSVTSHIITGIEGGSVSVQCHYDLYFDTNVKYLCRGEVWSSCKIIQRFNEKQRDEDKISISDDRTRGVFTVTVRRLEKKDAGQYWCGIDRAVTDEGIQLNLIVDEAQGDDKKEEEKREVSTCAGSCPWLCSDLMPLVSLFLFQEPVIMFPAVASVVVCIALALSGAAAQGDDKKEEEKREVSTCAGSCLKGWVGFNDQCYQYVKDKKTWADAEGSARDCRSMAHSSSATKKTQTTKTKVSPNRQQQQQPATYPCVQGSPATNPKQTRFPTVDPLMVATSRPLVLPTMLHLGTTQAASRASDVPEHLLH